MKKYFVTLHENFSIFKIIIISLVLSLLISLIYREAVSSDINIDWQIVFYLVLFVVIVFIFLVQKIVFHYFNNRSINYFDYYLLVWLITQILFVIVFKMFISDNCLIYWISIPSITITTGVLIFRIVFTTRNFINTTCVIDLKDLLDDQVTIDNKKRVYIDENSVKYDLLGREYLIGLITETLENLNPSGKFILSIEGEWGSGKSTILNMAVDNIKSKNIIVIDSFEPWHYNDEISMLRALIKSITDEIDIGIPSIRLKMLLKQYIDSVFDKKGLSLLSDLAIENSTIEDIEITKIINDYLEKNNKTIVFIIDNLDRTQQEHIFFIYKAVASLLRLNKIIYVLSFDRDIVYDALKRLNIKNKYLKKIIQKRFDLPNNYGQMNSIMIKGLKKYCSLINIDISSLSENDIFSLIEPIYDLRDFKIYLNQINNLFDSPLSRLNTYDLLAITLIRTHNIELFQNIYQNRHYFITEGLSEDINLSFSRYPDDKFEEQAKEFFAQFQEKSLFKNYIKIIRKLFPALENYKSGYSKLYSSSNTNEKESSNDKRISNAKYFDVYFTNSINRYIGIDEVVDTLVQSIKLRNFGDEDKAVFKQILDGADSGAQMLIFESIDYKLDNLELADAYILLDYIFENINCIDDAFISFRLNARRRAIYIIAKILFRLEENDFQDTIRTFVSPKNIGLLREIRYWISPEAEQIGQYSEEKFSYLSKFINDMSITIIEEKINLYKKENYRRHNFRVLEWELPDKSDLIRRYLTEIINPNNIAMFLYDYMQISSSSDGYGYKIEIDKVHNFLDKETILEMIEKSPNNNDNVFVKEVYINSLDISNDKLNHGILLYEQKILFNDI